MSILEMIIAAGLMALLLALVGQVVVPSLRLVGQSSMRTGLQQEGRTILDRLERDLRLSSGYGVALQAAPQTAVAIHRLAEGQFTGASRWEAQLVVWCYRPTERTLFRRTWPPEPPTLSLTLDATRPTKCSAADLQALAQAVPPAGNVTWLARNATAFTAERDPGGTYTFTLQLSEPNPATGKVENLSLTRSLYLRNH